MSNALKIRNLTKSYKDFKLENLSLEIPEGSVFGLIGENGSGKSTLINSILGIINSNYQTIQFFGKEFVNYEKEIKEKLAIILDQTHFDLEFTAKDIDSIMKNTYKKWDSFVYYNYLKRFDLPSNKKLKDFSRGMKMKLEFAVAFSHDAKFILLDEATSGLDPIIRDDILEILREYSEDESNTVLMSSHITSDLDKIADYIGFIHEGKLMFVKSYDEIRDNYGILKCGQEIFESLNEEDVVAFRKESHGYRVLVENKYDIKNSFQDLIIEPASLEDVMLFMVKGEKN